MIERANTPERNSALKQMLLAMTDDLNEYIDDPELDFDKITAVMIVGELLSSVILSVTDDEEVLLNLSIGWLEEQVRRINPDLEVKQASVPVEVVNAARLDAAVEGEGPGGGN